MVEPIEIGLAVYFLAGSASIGYWVLLLFWKEFLDKTKSSRLGYSALAGSGIAFVLLLVASLLAAVRFNEMTFLELLLAIVPLPFLGLAVFTLSIKISVWYQEQQSQVVESSENLEAPQVVQPESWKPIHTIEPTMPKPPSQPKSAKKEVAKAFKPIKPKKTEEPKMEEESLAPLISDEEPAPQVRQETSLRLEEEPEKKEPQEAGEQEKDVESEIRKIMKGESAEKKETEEEAPKESNPSLMSADEIEKIKSELRKKIRKGEENQGEEGEGNP